MTGGGDPLSLGGKVAVITGGGTGIGAETARLFARHGAAGIVLAARTESALAAVAADVSGIAAEAGNAGCTVLPVRTDVKDEASVVAMVAAAMAAFGRIDVLVNNAGGTRMGPLEDTPARGWEASVGLNMTGPFYCTREAGRHMIEARGGVIVNISSTAGINGVANGAAYSAAKAGLQMFTRVTAAEWGRHGIRANCIAVGTVASERASAAWERASLDPDVLAGKTALGRLGVPSDIAYPILFLSTDASSFVTGQVFAVDGGAGLGLPPR